MNLPNGNLNISAGRDVKLTKLGVFGRFACHEQHHRWEEPQGLGKHLIQVGKLTDFVVVCLKIARTFL